MGTISQRIAARCLKVKANPKHRTRKFQANNHTHIHIHRAKQKKDVCIDMSRSTNKNMKKRVGSIALTVLVALVALASVVSMPSAEASITGRRLQALGPNISWKKPLGDVRPKRPELPRPKYKADTLHHSHSETVTQGRDMSHLDGTTMAHGRQEESGKLEVEMKRLSLAYLSICVPIRACTSELKNLIEQGSNTILISFP